MHSDHQDMIQFLSNVYIGIEIPPHKLVVSLCDMKRVIKYDFLDKG